MCKPKCQACLQMCVYIASLRMCCCYAPASYAVAYNEITIAIATSCNYYNIITIAIASSCNYYII